MKNIKIVFVLLLLLVVSPMIATPVYAAPIDVPEIDQSVSDAHSGYVDENGEPISIEEFNEMREKESRNLYERNPFLALTIVAAIIGGAVFLGYKLAKKS